MLYEAYFDRGVTQKIKGIALILMFIHHFFTFPEWIVVDANYNLKSEIAGCLSSMTRVCVPVFVFLNGYFEYYKKDNSVKNTLKKITDILISYWVVYLLILVAAELTNPSAVTIKMILLEILALDKGIMCFCWYIPFYMISMILIKPVEKLMENGKICETIIGIIIPSVFFSIISSAFRKESTLLISDVFSNLANFFPLIVVGYLAAKHDVFSKILDKEIDLHIKSEWMKEILYTVLAVMMAFMRYLFPKIAMQSNDGLGLSKTLYINLDIVYTPIFVYCLIRIIQITGCRFRLRILSYIGKYSMYMWFFSCIFFNVSREYTQKVLYFPRIAVIVLVWGLLLCLLAGIIVDLPTKRIIAFKNRILFGKVSKV